MLLFIMRSTSYQTGARIHGVAELLSGTKNRPSALHSDFAAVTMAFMKAKEVEIESADS